MVIAALYPGGGTCLPGGVVAKDNGLTGAGDSFRIVLSDGYLAGGTLAKENLKVSSV